MDTSIKEANDPDFSPEQAAKILNALGAKNVLEQLAAAAARTVMEAGGATGQQDGNAPGASWNVNVGFNGGGATGVERLSTINLGVTHTGQLIILP